MIRFTDEEAFRLTKLLRKRRLTGQAFGHAAIMRALNEANLGKKTDGEIEREQERPQRSETPQGLGIRDRLRDDRVELDERESERERARYEPTALQQQPVVATRGVVDDEILSLARTVVESPQSSRREVLKAACRALSRGRTQEEAVRLAEDLDAAIQRIDGVPRTALERVRARMGR